MPGCEPLYGKCTCGAVEFQVDAPLLAAGYCHCERCQHRGGGGVGASGLAEAGAVKILSGKQLISTWRPPDGNPKLFCSVCGGHLFGGELDGEGVLAVRLGALEGDPEVRPAWHQWVSSAASWEKIPDDGLPRFDGKRPTGPQPTTDEGSR